MPFCLNGNDISKWKQALFLHFRKKIIAVKSWLVTFCDKLMYTPRICVFNPDKYDKQNYTLALEEKVLIKLKLNVSNIYEK